ncbi:MAG TPA: Crp/Fnr family transcriptional regulator [Terriglobales bacterium]|nr:Crp/Fnr family transcriptional regulator [Terriglobales bacterium]
MPRGFLFSNGCLDCPLRREGDFCHLPSNLLTAFHEVGNLTIYPPYAVLLREGMPVTGAHIICSGRVKLSVLARDGKTVILKVAGKRQVLGMSSVISGRPSPVEATTIESCQIKYVDGESFLRLVRNNGSVAMSVARLLSREIGISFRDVHDLLLARSSTEKLARLLLSWAAKDGGSRDLRIDSEFTHEEIAQMIGSSRETVTRLLSDLKRRELIRLEGSTLVIPNRVALEAIAS